MRPDRAQLLAQIESFDIEGNAVGLPFAARLARENGWSRAFADRVIVEYKRFVFLAMISDTPVCPSEDVDAAWHLHLTYTRSYWKRFCDGVLGRPLHHEPTKGGPAEHEKHLDMYGRTLALYHATFGQEPPRDIWTPADERFGEDLAHRVVNIARNWVIPKAPVKRLARLASLFAVVAVFVPGCNGGLNPFALEGSDFLGFLIPMMIAAVCVGRVLRSRSRDPEPAEGEDTPELTWEQAAYLAGGPARLTTAAIARLVSCGAARVEGDYLQRGGEVPVGVTAVETAVLTALPASNTTAALGPVAKAVDAVYADGARQLEEDGLLMSTSERIGAKFIAAVPLLIVLMGFALPRFVIGITNNKPTEYLVMTTFFGLVLGLAFAQGGTLRLTRRGELALANVKEKRRLLLTGTSWDGAGDAAMAVALFGTLALVGSEIAFLQTWYPRQAAVSSSGGCGTSGCGTGGCGGGAGGCGGGGGGCGGGGCGGCGGGD